MKNRNIKVLFIGLLSTLLLIFTVIANTPLVRAETDYEELARRANSIQNGAGRSYESNELSKQLTQAVKDNRLKYVDNNWVVVSASEASQKNKGQQTTTKTPSAQKAEYNGDRIQEAVSNANAGTASTDDNAVLTYATSKSLIEQNTNGQYTVVNATPPRTWTIFAELLMRDPDTKQGWSILGKGDVSADLPYSTISIKGNELASQKGSAGASGNKVGTKAAAILATFNKYNYFQTVSGNKLAVDGSDILSGIFRIIGGTITLVGSYLNGVMHGLAKYLGDFLVTFNPYSIMWGSVSTVVSKNPITQSISAAIQGLGITKSNLQMIFSISFIVITGFFAFRLMRNVSNGLNSTAIFDPTKKWFYRIVPVFVILPLFSLASGYVVQSYTSSDWGENTGVAVDYLINARYWAASSNLSPSGGYNASAPYAIGKDSYVDESYAPFKATGKSNIESINTSSYAWANGVDTKSLSQEEVSQQLIMDWMSNQTFNVNTWASDVRISDTDGRSARSSKATIGEESQRKQVDDENGKDGDKVADANELDKYIWSVAQNPDDTQIDPTNYNSKSSMGSADGFSWSTQSVALILQSSFDRKGATFYAYNISPTGAQKTMKNLSTVKTEWKEVSMVGTNGFGQFSSWLALTSGYLSLLIINVGIVMSLASIGLIDALGSFISSLFKTVLYGDPVEAIATFGYFAAMLLIGILSASLGGIIYKAVSSVATGINSLVNVEFLSGFFSGVIELLVAYFVARHDGKKRSIKGMFNLLDGEYEKTVIGRFFGAILEQAKIAHEKMRSLMPAISGAAAFFGNRGYYSRANGAAVNPYANKESWNNRLNDKIVDYFDRFRSPADEDELETPIDNSEEFPRLTNEPAKLGGYGSGDDVEETNQFRELDGQNNLRLTNDDFNDGDFEEGSKQINPQEQKVDKQEPPVSERPKPSRPKAIRQPANNVDDYSDYAYNNDEVDYTSSQRDSAPSLTTQISEQEARYKAEFSGSREDFKGDDLSD